MITLLFAIALLLFMYALITLIPAVIVTLIAILFGAPLSSFFIIWFILIVLFDIISELFG